MMLLASEQTNQMFLLLLLSAFIVQRTSYHMVELYEMNNGDKNLFEIAF